MVIVPILCLPIISALLSVFFKRSRYFAILNSFIYFLILFFSAKLILHITSSPGCPISYFNIFYIDALSGIFIFITSLITFAASVYSIGYIEKDVADKVISEKKALAYYGLFNLFVFSMCLSTMLNNLGFVWVAIEVTTLVSAFLVGFYNTKKSIEAAWKYIIICSVGISLALLGTMLFYYAASQKGNLNGLNWTEIVKIARGLDPNLLKIAFLFIVVGYGTKAGLVPMHTWLPDAHSQALAPISALLSGVLLETSLYVILRFTVVINNCLGASYSSNILMIFGMLSLVVSAGFILIQKDIKRLLAYSSVEHIGIMCLGVGFGGAIGLYGALFHALNHAITKSLMFFSAGTIAKRYGTSEMRVVRGASIALPFTGPLFILGAFALAGSPPFSVFISELLILIAGVQSGKYAFVALFLVFTAIIFGGMIYHVSKMVFGKKPEETAVANEKFSTKLSLGLLFVLICITGFILPGPLNKLLMSAADVLKGIQ